MIYTKDNQRNERGKGPHVGHCSFLLMSLCWIDKSDVTSHNISCDHNQHSFRGTGWLNRKDGMLLSFAAPLCNSVWEDRCIFLKKFVQFIAAKGIHLQQNNMSKVFPSMPSDCEQDWWKRKSSHVGLKAFLQSFEHIFRDSPSSATDINRGLPPAWSICVSPFHFVCELRKQIRQASPNFSWLLFPPNLWVMAHRQLMLCTWFSLHLWQFPSVCSY